MAFVYENVNNNLSPDTGIGAGLSNLDTIFSTIYTVQQQSRENLKSLLLTRIGENSKMVITGDLNQGDKLHANGLKDLYDKLNKNEQQNKLYLIELNENDIQIIKISIIIKKIKFY